MYLEHANFTVVDLDRSVAFYRELLDLDLRWQGTTSSGERAAHVGDERTYLALFEAAEPGPVSHDYGRPGLNHIAFVVDDLELIKGRLDKLGVNTHLEGDYEPGRRIYFYDPSNIEVELVEYPTGG